MKKAIKIVSTILILLIVGVGLCFTGIVLKAQANETVYEGIYIEDISLVGMTKDGVSEVVGTYVDKVLGRTVTLKEKDGAQIITTLSSIGGKWMNPEIIEEAYSYGRKGNLIQRYKEICNLKDANKKLFLTFSIDESMAKEFIKTNFSEFDLEPIDAIYQRKSNEVVIIPEVQGKKLNEEDTFLSLKEYVENNWKNETHHMDVFFDVLEAKGTKEEFSKMVDVLGSFTTNFQSSSASRGGNLINGCSKVNGTFLYPGESISVYEKCQPFTYGNGYFDAGAYLNGIVIESTGGGICQVTTTLYNAAIRSELEILERHPHSMIVTYVSLAEDSALSGTSKDLKFKNTLEHPIYIEGYTTDDKNLTFTIYGIEDRPKERKISFYSEKISEVVPTNERIIQDASFPFGYVKTQGVHIGYTAKLWKIVSIDGLEKERIFINESKYNPTPRTVIIGIGGASPDIAAAVGAAAATGSINEVRATVTEILATPPEPVE